jgi:hypothetical protein
MEVHDLAAALHRRSGMVVPDRPPSLSAGAQLASDAGAIQEDDARVDVVDRKGKEKEKVEEGSFNSTPNHHPISGVGQGYSLDCTPNCLACTGGVQIDLKDVCGKAPYTVCNVYKLP